MKKIISLMVALAALFVFAGCQSGKFTQEKANAAFMRIYNRYAKDIITDDSTYYTVQPGDSLSKIANESYGSGNGYYFPLIMLASRNTVVDPDLIQPGMELAIPNLQANLDDANSRAAMKSFFADVADIYEQKKNPTMKNALLEISNSL